MSATAKLPPDVAILVYDLRASGVSRNALAIADASLAADLSVELWVIRPQGHMQETAPEGVRVVQTPVGRKLPVGRSLLHVPLGTDHPQLDRQVRRQRRVGDRQRIAAHPAGPQVVDQDRDVRR